MKANLKAALEQIRAQAEVENIRVTQHAQQEMAEEDITTKVDNTNP